MVLGPSSPRLFDVHTHHPEKTAEGATHSFVASGFSPESNEEVMAFARARSQPGPADPGPSRIFFSLGLGPQEIQRKEKYPDLEKGIQQVEAQADQARSDPSLSRFFVAIGEVGLDKHWGKSDEERERQFVAFERMIALAGRLSLPLIIHSRDAEEECINQLLAASHLHAASGKKFHVLMHCFGGNLEQAKRCADAGWLVSIPPQPNSERKKIIKALDISSLVLESDAPYIGKTSADALQSAEMIARYKGMELEKVLDATAENAREFFGI